MESSKPRTPEEAMPPGKQKAPKPTEAPAPARPPETENAPTTPEAQPGQRRKDDEVLSPDGEFEPKQEPLPLL